MKKEAISHGVLEDLANRNDNWDKLDGVIDQVVELDESRLILKNEVVNGDFSDGTTGWASASSTGSISDRGTYLNKGNGSLPTPYVYANTSLINTNDKVYVESRAIPRSDKTKNLNVNYTLNNASAGTIRAVPSPVENRSYRLSNIVTIKVADDGKRFGVRIVHGYLDAITALDQVLEVINVSVINLTQTFGAGNEPTKEEMDIIVDIIGYFNGTHTITSKEQFNILLKMVRENALATTSLGGGF